MAKTMRPDQIIVVNLSGRGDKDMESVARHMGVDLGVGGYVKEAGKASEVEGDTEPCFTIGKDKFPTRIPKLVNQKFGSLEEFYAFMK
jgi:hypothetical protein